MVEEALVRSLKPLEDSEELLLRLPSSVDDWRGLRRSEDELPVVLDTFGCAFPTPTAVVVNPVGADTGALVKATASLNFKGVGPGWLDAVFEGGPGRLTLVPDALLDGSWPPLPPTVGRVRPGNFSPESSVV